MDYFRKYKSLFTTTSNSFSTGSTVDITLNSVTGLPTDTEITLTFDRVDSSGAATAGLIERIRGTISGGSFIVAERGTDGTTEQAHTSPVVEMIWNAEDLNDIITGVLVEHDQDGGHDAITATSVAIGGDTALTSNASASDVAAGTSAELVVTPLAAAPYANSSMSRQAIMNGNFNVNQRGTSLSLSMTDNIFYYLFDRWFDVANDDGGTRPALTRSQQILTSGDIPGSFYYSRLLSDGTGTSLGNSSFHSYRQAVEFGTRFLCGLNKKVTLSFWARSNISNKRIGVNLFQAYGSGGSPSATETLTGEIFTLTSTWTKYTKTFTTNTLVGKTFGTDNNDKIDVVINKQWGTTTATTRFGGGTAESYGGAGYIDIAAVELNAGDVALPFQPKSFEEELRACQRYCFAPDLSIPISNVGFGMARTTTTAVVFVHLPTTMRKSDQTLTATAGDYQLYDASGAAIDVTAIVKDDATASTKNMFAIKATVASGLTQYRPYQLFSDATANRIMIIESDL